MALVALGLGSNREPRRHLAAGLQALEARYGQLQLSDVFESEPVGFRGPDFLNLVATLETSETLEELFHFVKQLEASHGRLRDAPRFSDRSLDIDILLFGDLCGRYEVGGKYGESYREEQGEAYGEVILPRPEVTENAYVLRPLAQLLGARLHPPTGKTYGQLWEGFDPSTQRVRPAGFSFR